ncbi:MAG: phosphate regulon sensor histidine kinase PhoR [Leptothrix sp. (in: b-proteobacteria)]
MNYLMGRLVAAVLGLTAGGCMGWLVGRLAASPWWGAWSGAVIGLLLVNLRDALRSQALVNWLRGSQEGTAPRSAALWGDLAYRIERALRLRERDLAAERGRLAQFLSAIEASPNGVMMLDAESQISWLNSAAADHFGLDPKRDRGQRVTNLVRSPAFVAHLQGRRDDEAVTVADPGRGLTLSVLVRSYGDGLNLVLSSDVTERLRAEAMRRDFVANVSHEIRTPLTVLAGFVETMSLLPLTEVERRRVLDHMTQQTQRMQGLVADLLTLAQLEGSPRPPVDQWCSVASLLRQVETELRGLSRQRHSITFVIDDGGALAGSGAGEQQIACSQTEMMSAFTNLCSNAVRYTPQGGRIDVRWSVRPTGEGIFEVRDSGIGISREHLPRLTERFYRVDGSRSRETGGTGLGLSIVKHVMQRHGAELEIDSESGVGSTFRIRVPAARMRVHAVPVRVDLA